MKNCVSQQGHDWKAISFTSSAGSTPVACDRDGCDEIGYRLDDHVINQDQGSSNDEGLF